MQIKWCLYFLMVLWRSKNECRLWEVAQGLYETENLNNKMVDKLNGGESVIQQQKQSFESRSMGCKLTWQERDSGVMISSFINSVLFSRNKFKPKIRNS